MQKVTKLSFEDELNLVEQLVFALQEQQRALISRNIDAIENSSKTINNLSSELMSAGSDRQHEMNRLGFHFSSSGVEDWLEQIGRGNLIESWRALQASTEKAKELSRLNAGLVNKYMAKNHEFLSQLNKKAKSKSNLSGLYSKTGHRV